jgi:hypothetical protein
MERLGFRLGSSSALFVPAGAVPEGGCLGAAFCGASVFDADVGELLPVVSEIVTGFFARGLGLPSAGVGSDPTC